VTAEAATKRKRRALLAALVFVLLAGVLALFHGVTQWSTRAAARRLKNPIPATADAIDAGKRVYQRHCESCHGANGDGKGEKAAELSVAPGDFTDAQNMDALTDGELFWQITKGKRPMPAFEDKLTEQERWQVVDFIRTFAGKPAASPTASLVPKAASDQP
jgi:mono/diheme cytochrome c family protein